MRALIGIPAHDEVEHIAEVCAQAKPFGDVFVVNNGSTDETESEAKQGGAVVVTYPWSGYGRALQRIFLQAKLQGYDALVTIDGDGQHDPADIPRLLNALSRSDVVIGNRFTEGEKTPLHRRIVINSFNHAYGVGDSQCGFRAYNRRAIELMHITEEGMGASLQILSECHRNGLTVSEAPVKVKYLESKPPGTLLAQGMNLVETLFWATVWARPYTYLGVPAAILFALAAASGAWAINVYAAQHYLVPNAALLCGVSFLGSILLGSFTFFVTISRRIVRELSTTEEKT